MRKKRTIPVEEFEEFLTNLMYQTSINKLELKDIFLAWFRYSIAKLKRDGFMWIPYVGTFHVTHKRRRFCAGRSLKAKSQVKDCSYIRFIANQTFKKAVMSEKPTPLNDLIRKIEEHYLQIIQ